MSKRCELQKELPQSIGVLYIRWNIHNRIAVAVAYFELGEMVYMTVDKEKMQRICDNFLPKEVDYGYISATPIAMKNQKINAAFWDDMAIQQNGIMEIKKVSSVAMKLTRKQFNQFTKIYLG